MIVETHAGEWVDNEDFGVDGSGTRHDGDDVQAFVAAQIAEAGRKHGLPTTADEHTIEVDSDGGFRWSAQWRWRDRPADGAKP